MEKVRPTGREGDASVGPYTWVCGTNEPRWGQTLRRGETEGRKRGVRRQSARRGR